MTDMPRFAILSHDHPFQHWDFLLECGESCRTWRLLGCPDGAGDIVAEPIADHRLFYLDYTGPVSGGRGVVSGWDAGTFEWIQNNADVVRVALNGRKTQGIASLIRCADEWAFSMGEA
jgi:hypothetical protein